MLTNGMPSPVNGSTRQFPRKVTISWINVAKQSKLANIYAKRMLLSKYQAGLNNWYVKKIKVIAIKQKNPIAKYEPSIPDINVGI